MKLRKNEMKVRKNFFFPHGIGGVKSEFPYLCMRMNGGRTRQELRNTYPIIYQLWIYITKTYDVTTGAGASAVRI